jgi:hypothetical protein
VAGEVAALDAVDPDRRPAVGRHALPERLVVEADVPAATPRDQRRRTDTVHVRILQGRAGGDAGGADGLRGFGHDERAAEIAARTLALPDAQSVEDLTALRIGLSPSVNRAGPRVPGPSASLPGAERDRTVGLLNAISG